jgi:hypothetical protein
MLSWTALARSVAEADVASVCREFKDPARVLLTVVEGHNLSVAYDALCRRHRQCFNKPRHGRPCGAVQRGAVGDRHVKDPIGRWNHCHVAKFALLTPCPQTRRRLEELPRLPDLHDHNLEGCGEVACSLNVKPQRGNRASPLRHQFLNRLKARAIRKSPERDVRLSWVRHVAIGESLPDQRLDVAVNVRNYPGWPQHDVPLPFKASDVVRVVDERAIQGHFTRRPSCARAGSRRGRRVVFVRRRGRTQILPTVSSCPCCETV